MSTANNLLQTAQTRLQAFNLSNVAVDLAEAIGVTAGIIGGAYIVYKAPQQSYGAFIDIIIGVVLLMLFPNTGVLNGIGVGFLGYGLYQLIKLATNGAIV